MESIGKIDYTDEIAEALLALQEAYLPDELESVAAAKRPPAVQTWTQGSVGLVAASVKTPVVTVSSEPPGGVQFEFLGTGIPPGVLATVKGNYALYVNYALDYRPSERAMSQVRQAAASIAVVLGKYAVTSASAAELDSAHNLGWKAGLPRVAQSGDGKVQLASGKEGTYLFGSVRWTCVLHAGPSQDG